MDSSKPPASPVQWLIAANAAWLLAGILAYYTALRFTVLTAIAVLVAVPGLAQLRSQSTDEQARKWIDVAYSGAIGTWAVLAMLVAIPYVASEGGASLWSSASYARLGLVVASLGMALWNWAALQALAPEAESRSLRLYAAFHGVLLVAGLFVSRQVQTVPATLRGETIDMVDLSLAPALAAVAGLVWAVSLWRSRPQ